MLSQMRGDNMKLKLMITCKMDSESIKKRADSLIVKEKLKLYRLIYER